MQQKTKEADFASSDNLMIAVGTFQSTFYSLSYSLEPLIEEEMTR